MAASTVGEPVGLFAERCAVGDVVGLWNGLVGDIWGADGQRVERAGSVAIDPHEWLHIPFEAGAVLIKDAEAHVSTFEMHGA